MTVLVALLAFYAAACGFHASVIRSGIVAIALMAAPLVRREPDALSAIALACCLVLLFWPAEVFQLGFQLTFVAATALALFGCASARNRKTAAWALANAARRGLNVAGVAVLAITPVLMQRQHLLVGQSLLASALASLALPAVLAATLFGTLVGYLNAAVGGWVIGHVAGPLIGWIEASDQWMSSPGWARFEIPPFSGYWLVPLYGLGLMLWRPRVRNA
jgi:competence protein ComEC